MGNVNVFQWMSATVTQAFGQNGEQGTDFGLPIGTPIGSPVSGRVVYVGAPYAGTSTSSLGYVVQVLGDNGQLWHFQHLMAPSTGLAVGQNISTGDVVGYSGGCATYLPDGSGCASLDPACSISTSNPNCWSSGPHIEARWSPDYNSGGGVWGQNWQNSGPVIQQLRSLISKQYFAGQSAPTATPGQTPQVPVYQINAGMTGNAPCNDAVAQASASGGIGIGTYVQYAVCQLQQSVALWGIKIGLFLLALVLVILGGIILIHPDPASILGNAPGVKAVQSL